MATSMLDDRFASPTTPSVGGRVGRGARKAGNLRDASAREVCLFVQAPFALLPNCLAGVLIGTSLIARDRSPKE